MRQIVSAFLILALAGCSSLPGQMVGRFASPQDYIVVKKNTEVWWSPVAADDGQLRFIGFAAYYPNEPGYVYVVSKSLTDASPKLYYSSDYSRLTVDWHLASSARYQDRSTVFSKASDR